MSRNYNFQEAVIVGIPEVKTYGELSYKRLLYKSISVGRLSFEKYILKKHLLRQEFFVESCSIWAEYLLRELESINVYGLEAQKKASTVVHKFGSETWKASIDSIFTTYSFNPFEFNQRRLYCKKSEYESAMSWVKNATKEADQKFEEHRLWTRNIIKTFNAIEIKGPSSLYRYIEWCQEELKPFTYGEETSK